MGSPSVNIAVTTDISSLRSQMGQAASVAQDAASQISAAGKLAQQSWAQLASATLNANEANRVVKDTLRAIATGEVPMTTRATNDLALAQLEAAEASRQLAAAQKTVKTALGESNTQMASSFQQATMFSNVLGLRLGRGMEQVIARTPILASAMQTMFPITMGIAFFEMAVRGWQKLHEAYEQASEAAKNIRQDTEMLIARSREHSDAVEIQNAKLELQIAKLSGHPENGLALALAESKLKADQLIVSLKEAAKAEEDLMKKQSVGFAGSLFTGQAQTQPAEDQIQKWNDKLASMSSGGASAKAIHDQMAVFMNQAQKEASQLTPGGSLNPDGSANTEAMIAMFERFVSRMKQLRKEMEDDATNATLVEQLKGAEQAKALAEQTKRAAEEAEKQKEEARKLAQFKLELANNGMGNMADSLSEMPKGTAMENIRRIEEAVKKSREDLGKAVNETVSKSIDSDLEKMIKGFQEAKEKARELREEQDLQLQGERDRKLAPLQERETRVKGQAELGRINPEQELAQLRALHQLELAEELDFIAKKTAADKGNEKELLKDFNAQQKLEHKGLQQELQDEIAQLKQREQAYKAWVQSVSSSMFSGVNAWIQHQKTFTQAMKQEWNSVAMDSIKSIEQVAEKKYVTDNLMKLGNKLFHADDLAGANTVALAKMGLDTATMAAAAESQTSGLVLTGMINSMAAESYAAVAAAAALSATAAIPIVGPALAPAAATAMLSVGEIYAAMAAFDNGGVMPKTGMAHLLQGEGVLTKPATQMLQTVMHQVNNGGLTRRDGDTNATFSPTIHAMDGLSVARTLRRSSKQVTKEFSRAIRTGKLGSL